MIVWKTRIADPWNVFHITISEHDWHTIDVQWHYIWEFEELSPTPLP